MIKEEFKPILGELQYLHWLRQRIPDEPFCPVMEQFTAQIACKQSSHTPYLGK
jgi:hypothetical protein